LTQADYDKQKKAGGLDPTYENKILFEKKYGGKVSITVVKEISDNKLMSLIATKKSPDIMNLGESNFPTMAAIGNLIPLESISGFNKSLWNTDMYNAFMYMGKHYGIQLPNYRPSMRPFHYNVNLFDQYNVEKPWDQYKKGTWNFANFAKAGKALTKDTNNDGKYDLFGFNCYGIMPSDFTLANDTQIITVDAAGAYKANLKNPKVMNVIREMFNWVQAPEKGGFINYNGGCETFEADWNNKKLAMTAYIKVDPTKFKWKWNTVPFPYGPDNKEHKVSSSIGAYGIPKFAKNPMGAFAWLYLDNTWETGKYKTSILNSNYDRYGGTDAAMGKRIYDEFYNYKTSNLKYKYANDRAFQMVWDYFYNIPCQMGVNKMPAAQAAEEFGNKIQEDLDKSYGIE
jgi:maltose-binding protein MalE